MRYRPTRRQILKGAAAFAGLAVAGCATGPQPTAGTTATAPTQPKRGGSLVLAGATLTHLDPHRITGAGDLWYGGLGYNQLVRWPKDPDKGFGPEPELAESWELAPDGLSIVFKLRKGVKFQNVAPVNGREFTAEDAKWNIERWSSNKPIFPRRDRWKVVQSIDVVDKYTLKLTLSQPWPDLLIETGQRTSKILAREAVEAAGDDDKFNANGKLQIGTGPFILQEVQQDVGSKWVRNPEYWKPGLPYVDNITVRIFPDQTPRFAALRSGEVADMGWFLSGTQYKILQGLSGFETADRAGTSWTGLMFNMKLKPFDDVRVRRALALALDPDAIVKAAYQEGAVVNRGAVPAIFKEGLPASEWPKRDVNRAKQLLTEAGLPNGFKFRLMVSNNREEATLGGQLIKEQLAAIGAEATLELEDSPSFVRRATAKEYEANFIGTWAGDVSTSGYLDVFFLSTASRNFMGYNNPQFDQLVLELNRTYDLTKRVDLAHRAQRILIEDMPVANILVARDFYAWHSWLKGYGVNWVPGAMAVYAEEFWVDR